VSKDAQRAQSSLDGREKDHRKDKARRLTCMCHKNERAHLMRQKKCGAGLALGQETCSKHDRTGNAFN